MSTLVIQSRGIIANPKYGKVPDLTAGLRVLLDARTLSLTQDAPVSAWVGTGIGTDKEKGFAVSSTGMPPKFDKLEKPSVKFDGTSLLANTNISDSIIGAASYIVVAKITNSNIANDNENRIVSGTTADGYQSIQVENGKVKMTGGLTNTFNVDTGTLPTSWFVGIYVFDGVNSKSATSTAGNAIVKHTTAKASTQSRVALGGNINLGNLNGKGMQGNIALYAQYDKALSDTEITTLMNYYKNEFSVL